MSADDVLRELARVSESDLGRLLAGASRVLNDDLMTRLAASGHPLIRPSHLAVFAGLQPGGSQITELAQHAGVSRQALSSLVREVEGLGYVRTTPDPRDRRAVLVELTEQGIALCRSAIALSGELTASYEQRWGAGRLDDLRTRLREIAANRPDAS